MAQTIFCDEPGCDTPADLLMTHTDGSQAPAFCWVHYMETIRAMVHAVEADEAMNSDLPGPDTEVEPDPAAEPDREVEPAAPSEPEEPVAPAPEPDPATEPEPEPARGSARLRAARLAEATAP